MHIHTQKVKPFATLSALYHTWGQQPWHATVSVHLNACGRLYPLGNSSCPVDWKLSSFWLLDQVSSHCTLLEYVYLPGSSLRQRAVASVMASRPRSLVPDCIWTSMYLSGTCILGFQVCSSNAFWCFTTYEECSTSCHTGIHWDARSLWC